MRISHKNKFIFLSKPRCASTAIRAILDPYSDVFSSSAPPFHHHTTAMELKMYFDTTHWPWEEYFVFTTVRNPWEMVVSYFTFFRPDINGLYNFEKERNGVIYQGSKLASFKDWILMAKTYHRLLYLNGTYLQNKWVDGLSKLSLANTINDIDGKSLVNRVLKVENIDTELYDTLQALGILIEPNQKRINTSEHMNYQDYYDPQTKKIVGDQFISDIEYGKYTF